MSKKDDQVPILTPHDHDVLCGRGGLTNHHPGNAWYRRLVRCNRPLYRMSPKHTKLLVSKAIVHHVHNQDPPGRFLEIQKSTGMWFEVSYKRAVDKTSQALRERDRENEGAADVPILAKSLAQSSGAGGGGFLDAIKKTQESLPQKPTIVIPTGGQQLNGGTPLINVENMGSLGNTMGNKNLLNGNNNNNNNNNNRNGINGINNNKGMGAHGMHDMLNSLGTSNDQGGNDSWKRPRLETSTSWFGWGSSNKRQKVDDQHHHQQQQRQDPVPLPTQPLQERASSIFRFFQGTKLFGSGRAATANDNIDTTALMNTINPSQALPAELEPRPLVQEGGFKADPPTLTRLTTQVSDWLHSFFPLHSAGGGKKNDATQQQQQLQNSLHNGSNGNNFSMMNSNGNANGMMGGSKGNMMGGNMNDLMGANLMDNTSNNNNNNNSLGGNANLLLNGMNGINGMNGNNMGNNANALLQLMNQNQNQDAAPPPQTGLQQSVSSAFLTLASGPSRLFSSVSGLFRSSKEKDGDNSLPANVGSMGNNNNNNNNALERADSKDDCDGLDIPAPTNLIPKLSGSNSIGSEGSVSLGRKTAKTSSLLDEYEETPMETRLRTVTSK